MIRNIGLCLACVALLDLAALSVFADQWVSLNGERSGIVVSEADGKLRVRLHDGTVVDVQADEVIERLTPDDLRDEAERQSLALTHPPSANAAAQRLRQLGPVVSPYLAPLARDGRQRVSIGAFAAMQFSYDPSCRPVVIDKLDDPNDQIRRMAVNILARHEQPEDLPALYAPLLEEDDGRRYGPALAVLLDHQPDAEQMIHGLRSRWAWTDLAPLLPRYQDGGLTERTEEMLRRGGESEASSAIVALQYQRANDGPTRRQVLRRLSGSDALLRDRAADYLRWHGTLAELPASSGE